MRHKHKSHVFGNLREQHIQRTQNDTTKTILSKLDYCSCLLNGLTQKNITRLRRIQSRYAKLIFKRPKLTHVFPLLHVLHWLLVLNVSNSTPLFMWQFPAYLSCLLSTQKSSSYFLRSSKGILWNIPRSRTMTGDRAFSVSAVRLWHHLPPSVRNTQKMDLSQS